MQKTINEMAQYIKNLIPSSIPETYEIKPMFLDIADEETIRNGVLAFRELLYSVCDLLINEGSVYEKRSSVSKGNDSHPSLPKSYPFLDYIKSILFNIGYHGVLNNNNNVLLLDDIQLLTTSVGIDGRAMKAKISNSKVIEVLKFLNRCGLHFRDVDLDVRKINITDIKKLEISYPNNQDTLIGLKAMAIAQKELYEKGKHDIFLRCDYRVLKEEDIDVLMVLKDFVESLSTKVQEFTLELHQYCLDEGLRCVEDVFYLGVRFIYFYKNKEVWTISSSIDTGYRILIKANNTDQYGDVIKSFPKSLQDLIARGYGCNKKLFNEPCQKGCHGFSFSLDDSILDIKDYIKIWINTEISYLHKY